MNRYIILAITLICVACQSKTLPIAVPVYDTAPSLRDLPTATATIVEAATQTNIPEPTSTSDAGIELSSHYTVAGTNPDNRPPYQGEVTITRNGVWYDIVWTIGADTFKGFGILEERVLFVRWIGPDCRGFGIATYTVQVDGTLNGIWTIDGQDGQGTEVLTPLPR